MPHRQVKFSEPKDDEEVESEEEFDVNGRINDPVARMKAQREAKKRRGKL